MSVSENGNRYSKTRNENQCEGAGYRGWKIVNGEPEPSQAGYCANRAHRFGLCGACAAYAQVHGIEHHSPGESEVLALTHQGLDGDDYAPGPMDVADTGDSLPAFPDHATAERRRCIREQYAAGRSQVDIAQSWGMSTRQVQRITRGAKRTGKPQRAKRGEGVPRTVKTSRRIVEVDPYDAPAGALRLTAESVYVMNEEGAGLTADLEWERVAPRKRYSKEELRAPALRKRD